MGAAILVQAEGRSAKPHPAAKADLESLFNFHHGEKSSIISQHRLHRYRSASIPPHAQNYNQAQDA
jgi:hypothetical protein